MIGKALKPLAKIKKKAWSAMGGAFKQIRKSVDPMKGFSKILEIVNVLMLPLTYIFTILAMIILKALMPYLGDLIIILGDLEQALRDVGEAAITAIDSLHTWYVAFNEWFESTVVFEWIAAFSDILNIGLIKAIEGTIETIEDLIEVFDRISLSGGGGGTGGGFSWPWEEGGGWPTGPVGGQTASVPIIGASSNTSNSININLQGSIIDDRDKLIRDIVEQVVIRL